MTLPEPDEGFVIAIPAILSDVTGTRTDALVIKADGATTA